ncbi:MAG: hypothetical protein PHT07_12035, partial [Paludibacter sp.]|nr:hypothetical protein [Paludibacter sp.]
LFHEIRPVWDAYDLGIITAICVRIDNAVFKALHNLVYGGLFLCKLILMVGTLGTLKTLTVIF